MQIQIFQPNDVTPAIAELRNQKNARVSNNRGQVSFGLFPSNNHNFPVGDIHLKLGFIGNGHRRSGAFGLRHIWEKHGSELGLTAPQQVSAFIETILQPGANVIVNHSKSPDKPLIVESSNGLITLGMVKPNNESAYYHIITAYGRKSHPGIIIANL